MKIHRTGGLQARATGLAIIGALAFVTTTATAQGASSRSTPRIATTSGGMASYLQRRPFRIVYSGDGAALLAGAGSIRSHLTWTTWNRSQARARGDDWHDNCEPSCADGSFAGYRVLIHAYRPRRVLGYLVFTRLTTTYTTGRRPPYRAYRRRSITYKLEASSQYGTTFWWSTP